MKQLKQKAGVLHSDGKLLCYFILQTFVYVELEVAIGILD